MGIKLSQRHGCVLELRCRMYVGVSSMSDFRLLYNMKYLWVHNFLVKRFQSVLCVETFMVGP